jgi:pterin-4a-carbinolamine dehydratase
VSIGVPLSDQELERMLSMGRHYGWRASTNCLERELRFKDFDDGMAFMQEVGRRAVDHLRHPDMCIAAGRVRLSIRNRHHAGVTRAELDLAAKVNEVLDGWAQAGTT